MQAKKELKLRSQIRSDSIPWKWYKIIKNYVQNTEGLIFHNSVKFTTWDNNESPENNSNNKDNNKNKVSEVGN